MTKHQCKCGKVFILKQYRLTMDGSIPFRDYLETCPQCREEILTRYLIECDLENPKYLN